MKRYDLVDNHRGFSVRTEMEESPHGDWVRYDDFIDVKSSRKNDAEVLRTIIGNLERCTSGNYMHRIRNATTILSAVADRLDK